MKILIPVFSPATGTWGGLTRAIAVAEAAQKVGHQVAFCAAGGLGSNLQQRGFTVYPIPSPTMFGLPRVLSRILEKRSQHATIPVRPGRDFGNIWFVLLLSGMARLSYLYRLVEAELRAARDFKAEFIFTDLDPGAFLLAGICRLPIAAAYQTPMEKGIGTLAWRLTDRSVGSVLEKYGCERRSIEVLFHGPQVLKIIPSIPELEGTADSREDVRYVGQLLGDIQAGGKFKPEEGKRYIFVYLGTGAVPLGKVREVLPKVFTISGRYICLAAAQSIKRTEKIGGVELRNYIPAAEVLPHCDWVICHGGQNTIIQSLMNGVPLMLFPGSIFERRFNSRKVQAARAGLMGELSEFRSQWIQTTLAKQSTCAQQAMRLADKIRSYGGGAAAVEAMESWVQR